MTTATSSSTTGRGLRRPNITHWISQRRDPPGGSPPTGHSGCIEPSSDLSGDIDAAAHVCERVRPFTSILAKCLTTAPVRGALGGAASL
jgi:hypothetical protein